MTIKLPKFFITSALALLYTLAFIITPYWTLGSSKSDTAAILIFAIGAGILWSFFSSSEIQIRITKRELIDFALLIALVVLLNCRELISVIPWRGDEDYHITKTLDLITRVPASWYLVGILFFGMTLYLSRRESYWAFFLVGLIVLGVIAVYDAKNPFAGLKSDFLLRYPFVNYWFYSIIPEIASVVANPYYEILYRIVPPIFVAITIWIILLGKDDHSWAHLFFWSLAIATIPIIFYYSSIFYLELPAIGLMVIVCVYLNGLLKDDFSVVKRNPSWYALLLIGFVKETVLPFLGCFIFIRLVFSIRQGRFREKQAKQISEHIFLSRARIILDELILIFSILFPLLFYLYLRSTLTQTRGFSPNTANLLDLSIYLIMAKALLIQFGIFLLLFAIGCVYLVVNKQFYLVSFFLLVLLSNVLFYFLDNKLYAGYSRYDLFLLPPILASTKGLIDLLSRKPVFLGLGIASVAIATNLLALPINVDGTKKPLWGSYLVDTADHYYPYRDALIWLKENHPNDKILITGMYYPYFSLDFYFNQFNWRPQYTQVQIGDENDYFGKAYSRKYSVENITQILTRAEQNGYSVVLYHDLENQIPQILQDAPFELEKVIQNQAHILLIYYRKP